MSQVVYKVPSAVKPTQRKGKPIFPWSISELEVAVDSYLRVGGFTARYDSRFTEFANRVRRVNPSRSDGALKMVFFTIARHDKMNKNSKFTGGIGNNMRVVLSKVDPSQQRFKVPF